MKPLIRNIKIPVFNDDRGTLHAIDESVIPFTPKRTFYLKEVPAGKSRAGHAVDAELFIMALSGSVSVKSPQVEATRINDNLIGLYIPAKTYIELTDFSSDALIAIYASKSFSETNYYSLEQVN